MHSNQNFFHYTKLIILTVVLVAGLSYLQAWTGPPSGSVPPACPTGEVGCDAPVNVSSTAQAKTGSLSLTGASGILVASAAIFGAGSPSDSVVDINGAVRLGMSGITCNATNNGALRYNTTGKVFEYCDAASWKSIATTATGGGYLQSVKVYPYTGSNQTWTRPTGVTRIKITVVGGGGNGTSGGGGGAGGACIKFINVSSLASATVFAGNVAGSSSFSSGCSATGGTAGYPGAGGVGSQGDINVTGGSGALGFAGSIGAGGASIFGGGFGAGGSGGQDGNGSPFTQGGTSGVVIVEEYGL